MRKVFILLFTALLFSSALADDIQCISMDELSMGDDIQYVVSLLEQQGVGYSMDQSSEGSIIRTALSAFGCHDSYPNSTLRFDENEKLIRIITGLPDVSTMAEAYDICSEFLGKADVISFPDYVDYDFEESNLEYSYSSYVVWIRENEFYELELYTSIYTDIKGNYFVGFEYIHDDSPMQYIEMTVYPISALDRRLRVYY
ncbi:MAG: hypothetical protein ACI4MM_05125 [Candidatus Ventricola sp.]